MVDILTRNPVSKLTKRISTTSNEVTYIIGKFNYLPLRSFKSNYLLHAHQHLMPNLPIKIHHDPLKFRRNCSEEVLTCKTHMLDYLPLELSNNNLFLQIHLHMMPNLPIRFHWNTSSGLGELGWQEMWTDWRMDRWGNSYIHCIPSPKLFFCILYMRNMATKVNVKLEYKMCKLAKNHLHLWYISMEI